MNRDRLISSLRTLEHFTNESLGLSHHSPNLSGFHYNGDLLKAAVANTYVETVSNRSDSLYLAIEESSPSSMKNPSSPGYQRYPDRLGLKRRGA